MLANTTHGRSPAARIGRLLMLLLSLGLAVDLGTSRVVLRLVNLRDGERLAEGAFDNPQIAVGPDILDRTLTGPQIAERLRDPGFRNRSLGSLYLDQRFLAGNGNYLRSEILWAAALDPARKPAGLAAAELETLATETLRLARRSYRTRGVTVAPALAKKLQDDGLTYEAYRFYVFGREGLPCHRCGSPIERRTMGSRNLFACPSCQTRKRAPAGVPNRELTV